MQKEQQTPEGGSPAPFRAVPAPPTSRVGGNPPRFPRHPSHRLPLLPPPGAASEQSETVQPGDEILQLAGTAAQGLTRFEAWNIIKTLPDGPVTIVIRRRGLQSSGTSAAGDP